MKRIIWVCVFVLAMASVSAAQNKVSGTLQCSKPDPQHMIEIGDRASHALEIEQVKCVWIKSFEEGGIQSKEGMSTSSGEINGNMIHLSGFHITTMANGDKSFVSYHGSSTMKDGKPGSAQGTWAYTGGTGKLKGIKGKGTFKGTPAEDGGMTYEVEGEYELPPGK